MRREQGKAAEQGELLSWAGSDLDGPGPHADQCMHRHVAGQTSRAGEAKLLACDVDPPPGAEGVVVDVSDPPSRFTLPLPFAS